MILYLLTTKGIGDFYVIANNVLEAQQRLDGLLYAAKYSHSTARKIIHFEVLTEELTEFPLNKPNFSSGNRLILLNSCPSVITEIKIPEFFNASTFEESKTPNNGD